ncbi:MAG: hypothetical protein ACE5JK_06315 [Candidatus Omnitrophota bacterium]
MEKPTDLSKTLNLEWDQKLLTGFMVLFLPYVTIAIFGVLFTELLTGIRWMLRTYVVLVLGYFLSFIMGIRGFRHPVYPRKKWFIHCIGGHALPEIWGHHPRPAGAFGKTLKVLGYFSFAAFPLACQAYGIYYILYRYESYGLYALLGLVIILSGTALGTITFFVGRGAFFCPFCVDFSCPFNKVPKQTVDEYLRRNPVLREAWEKSGYRLDEKPGEGQEP